MLDMLATSAQLEVLPEPAWSRVLRSECTSLERSFSGAPTRVSRIEVVTVRDLRL